MSKPGYFREETFFQIIFLQFKKSESSIQYSVQQYLLFLPVTFFQFVVRLECIAISSFCLLFRNFDNTTNRHSDHLVNTKYVKILSSISFSHSLPLYIELLSIEPWSAAKKTLSQCRGVTSLCLGSQPKVTCPECYVCSLMKRVILK